MDAEEIKRYLEREAERERRMERWRNLRWLIPLVVSLAALVISICRIMQHG